MTVSPRADRGDRLQDQRHGRGLGQESRGPRPRWRRRRLDSAVPRTSTAASGTARRSARIAPGSDPRLVAAVDEHVGPQLLGEEDTLVQIAGRRRDLEAVALARRLG